MKKLAAILASFFMPLMAADAREISRPNQMVGIDWATRGYASENIKKTPPTCSSYATVCIRRWKQPSACQAARARCIQTGAFVGLTGRRFEGLEKR
jgi:hypothetical protein